MLSADELRDVVEGLLELCRLFGGAHRAEIPFKLAVASRASLSSGRVRAMRSLLSTVHPIDRQKLLAQHPLSGDIEVRVLVDCRSDTVFHAQRCPHERGGHSVGRPDHPRS